MEHTRARETQELVTEGALFLVNKVASSSSRPRIFVVSSRCKYAKFHLCKAVLFRELFCPGLPSADFYPTVCWDSATRTRASSPGADASRRGPPRGQLQILGGKAREQWGTLRKGCGQGAD